MILLEEENLHGLLKSLLSFIYTAWAASGIISSSFSEEENEPEQSDNKSS